MKGSQVPPVSAKWERAPYNSVLQARPVAIWGLAFTWLLNVANHGYYLLFYIQEYIPVGSPIFLLIIVIIILCLLETLLSWAFLLLVGVWTHLVIFLLAFSLLNILVRLGLWSKLGQTLLRPLLSIHCFNLACLHAPTQTALSYVPSHCLCDLCALRGYWRYILALGVTQTGALAAFWLRTPAVPVHLHGLAPGLAGFRIAVLSDIHAGPSVFSWQIGRAVDAANALNPGFIGRTCTLWPLWSGLALQTWR